MEYFINVIKKKHKKDISNDNKALGKLRRECERAKRALSSQQEARVGIEFFFDGVDFSEPLTRARFEELNNDLFKRTMGHVKKAMDDAGLQKSQIDEILLVGGSTRIPKVQQLLKDFFDGKEPNKSLNPDEAVAYGAAIYGGIFSGEEAGQKVGEKTEEKGEEGGQKVGEEGGDKGEEEAGKKAAEEEAATALTLIAGEPKKKKQKVEATKRDVDAREIKPSMHTRTPYTVEKKGRNTRKATVKKEDDGAGGSKNATVKESKKRKETGDVVRTSPRKKTKKKN